MPQPQPPVARLHTRRRSAHGGEPGSLPAPPPGADSERAKAERLEELFARLALAPAAVLMLDYDGTLAPFTSDRAQAYPYQGVREALGALMRDTDTRVAIVSGRWLRTLTPLLGLDPSPELWGCHGRERCLPGGTATLEPISEAALRALSEADGWADGLAALGGRVEHKPGSIAFHWRGCAGDQVGVIHAALMTRIQAQNGAGGLQLLPFDGGLELRAPGCDKGTVVRTLTREAGPGALMAYLGDDLTDEDAFAALGPAGLSVLVRTTARPTHAAMHLIPPHELLAFLHRWTAVRGARR